MNHQESSIAEKPWVCLEKLHKTFDNFVAVNQIDLSIHKGEFLTFLGSSGSGKSTTLSMIAGFESPTTGNILLNEKSIVDVPSHKRGIGMVFQNYSLFPHMTVRENIRFPLDIRDLPNDVKEEKVNNILNLVQLETFADRRPSMLSGGQKQRVAIARALVYEPEILLMDEPLGALDKKLREDLQDELRQLHKRLGITIIYVTHDQDEAMRLSERIAIFKQGNIVGIGTGKDLYQQPPNAFVASFLGNSNFMKVSVTDKNTAIFENTELSLNQPLKSTPQGEALLMVRPEHIQVLSKEQAAAIELPAGFNQITATIDERVFLGESLTCNLSTASGCQIMSKCIANDFPDLYEGDKVYLRWNAALSSLYDHWEEKDIMNASAA